MSSTKVYDKFNDFFFNIVTNDKWSWSIYFEFTLASSLVPKTECVAVNTYGKTARNKIKTNTIWKVVWNSKNNGPT